MGLFCITSTTSHYRFIPSQRKRRCIYLTSPVPPALHLQLECSDYPALVTQFSSLCHSLNEDFNLFCSSITALDNTRKKREKPHQVMSPSAAVTGGAQCSSRDHHACERREVWARGSNETSWPELHLPGWWCKERRQQQRAVIAR